MSRRVKVISKPSTLIDNWGFPQDNCTQVGSDVGPAFGDFVEIKTPCTAGGGVGGMGLGNGINSKTGGSASTGSGTNTGFGGGVSTVIVSGTSTGSKGSTSTSTGTSTGDGITTFTGGSVSTCTNTISSGSPSPRLFPMFIAS